MVTLSIFSLCKVNITALCSHIHLLFSEDRHIIVRKNRADDGGLKHTNLLEFVVNAGRVVVFDLVTGGHRSLLG